MLKHCKVIAFTWNTCPLYVDGKEVAGATQEYCTIKATDASKTGLNALIAMKNRETYTVNFMCGDNAELTEALKAAVVVGAPLDLYVERVEVEPFGRVWTSGERAGQDVVDGNGNPIKFTSVQVIRDRDCDMVREAERERARGIANGSMFEWEEDDIATAAEHAAAADPIASVPANTPAPGTPNQQRRR